jgi:hypothetical protein
LTTLNSGNNAQLDSISCTAVNRCSAVGWYTTHSGVRLFVTEESRRGWSNPIAIGGLLIDGLNVLVSSVISCASPDSCSASGIYSVNSSAQTFAPSHAFVVDETDGRWRQAVAMPGVTATRYVNVSAISCGEPGYCAVGGSFAGSAGTTAFVDTQVDGTWGEATTVPGITEDGRFDSKVSSISCSGEDDCSAGGTVASRLGDNMGFVDDSAARKWNDAVIIAGPRSLHLNYNSGITSLSCRASGDCTALGFSDYRANSDNLFVVSEVQGTWGRATALRGLPGFFFEGFNNGIISCGSPGNCAVGGMYSLASGAAEPFVMNEVNGKWGVPLEVPGIGKLNNGNYAWVQAISCGSDARCAAVGGYSGALEAPAFFATLGSKRT